MLVFPSGEQLTSHSILEYKEITGFRFIGKYQTNYLVHNKVFKVFSTLKYIFYLTLSFIFILNGNTWLYSCSIQCNCQPFLTSMSNFREDAGGGDWFYLQLLPALSSMLNIELDELSVIEYVIISVKLRITSS